MHDDDLPNEREAVGVGFALLKAKWCGNSQFDKGMRLLQERFGIRHKHKKRPGGRGRPPIGAK